MEFTSKISKPSSWDWLFKLLYTMHVLLLISIFGFFLTFLQAINKKKKKKEKLPRTPDLFDSVSGERIHHSGKHTLTVHACIWLRMLQSTVTGSHNLPWFEKLYSKSRLLPLPLVFLDGRIKEFQSKRAVSKLRAWSPQEMWQNY